MKQVVIIGGGFGGLACAHALRGCVQAEVTLIDRKATFDFLPVLPDVIGGRISPSAASMSLALRAKHDDFRFIQDEVSQVDMNQRIVHGQTTSYEYDYLVIAAGTHTNFYGNDDMARKAFKLDNVDDANRICEAVQTSAFNTAIVVGGGYTGIEIATNLRRRLSSLNVSKQIVIVEASGSILNTLPEWMVRYVKENLAHLKVDVLVNSRVECIENNRVILSDGRVFDPSIVIWAAGVQTPPFVRDMKSEKAEQGRLNVTDYLQMEEHIFSIGDTTAFVDNGHPLRMAVQFAVAQGKLTGKNILRCLHGQGMRPYRSVDRGYIIPMANLHACGELMGVQCKGLPAIFMHYSMCIRRSLGLRKKMRMLRDLLKSLFGSGIVVS